MERLKYLANCIDRINDTVGTIISYLIVIVGLFVVYEVIRRYVFNSPTLWVWDLNIQLAGLMCIFGGGYALLYETHVSIDIFVERLPDRITLLIKLILYFFFFFAISILVWKGTTQAWHSFIIKEHYTSLWSPPLYPLRMAIPIGALLFLFQGLSNFIKDLISFLILLKQDSGNES